MSNEDEALRVTTVRQRFLAFAGGMTGAVALGIGGVAAGVGILEAVNDPVDDGAAASLYQTSMNIHLNAHVEYMGGLASGLAMKGVHVDPDTLSRIETIERGWMRERLSEELADLRTFGMAAAVQGGVSAADFKAYVDHVASLDAGVRLSIDEASHRLSRIPGVARGGDLARIAATAALIGVGDADDDGGFRPFGELALASAPADRPGEDSPVLRAVLDEMNRVFETVRTRADAGGDLVQLEARAIRAMAAGRIERNLDRMAEAAQDATVELETLSAPEA